MSGGIEIFSPDILLYNPVRLDGHMTSVTNLNIKPTTYKMNRYHAFIAMWLLAGAWASARSLSPQEALSRLDGRAAAAASVSRSSEPLSLSLTVGSPAAPAAYLFSARSGGYMLVSADDVAAPLLGYGDARIDPDSLPDNLRWWMGEYRRQIEAASAAGLKAYSETPRKQRKAIAPMLATAWGQDLPYNLECPELNGERSVTGCVATAMAQVMNYHRWPVKASPDAEFKYYWRESGDSLSRSFANYRFDWDNMLASYSPGGYTQSQADAVAGLMAACGYSVNMTYSPSGSGAYTTRLAPALVRYYGYDKGACYMPRDFFILSAWEDLVYNDLAKSQPVLYSGSNADGGHSFVCDGCDADGFFHIDWGWTGYANGYFRLYALDPDQERGLEGTSSGFATAQNVILGVKRPAENKPAYNLLITGKMGAVLAADGATVRINSLSLYNYSAVPVSGRPGIRIETEDGDKVLATVFESDEDKEYKECAQVISLFTVPADDFPKAEGTYRLYPVFRTAEGDVIPIRCYADSPDHLLLTIGSDLKWTFSKPQGETFSVSDFRLLTRLYQNHDCIAEGYASWTGHDSYSRQIFGLLLTKNSETSYSFVEKGDLLTVEFPADGAMTKFRYVNTWSARPGNYHLVMATAMNGSFEYLSEPVPVTLQADPGDARFEIVSWDVSNPESVDPAALEISADVRCTNGLFYDYLRVAVFCPRGNIGEFATPKTIINSGETVRITASGAIAANPGEKCEVVLFDRDGGQLTGGYPIVFAKTTGIADLRADVMPTVSASASPNPALDRTFIRATSEILRVELVSMLGVPARIRTAVSGTEAEIDLSALTPGIYIGRIETVSGSTSVKIVKK